jgi:hypothetical protein
MQTGYYWCDDQDRRGPRVVYVGSECDEYYVQEIGSDEWDDLRVYKSSVLTYIEPPKAIDPQG